ncbi:MAG: hypothetical protein EU547_02765 [Promethearchaeota archaeon]|nr:MAG: hypothetical protein EU547_02765 [Candidatus Lokiarchaeota archaeon]
MLGLIPTALAFLFYNKGIKNDYGGKIAILGYFEPLVATINSILFQSQNLSIFIIFGGSLILMANIQIIRKTS